MMDFRSSRLMPFTLIPASVIIVTAQTLHPDPVFPHRIENRSLTPIPDPEGFAGSFAGVSGGALIVAGGANITGNRWAEPPSKKWYDCVFVLDEPDGNWKSGFKLPRPLGYGVSVTSDDGILCFGGSDDIRHYADGFRLEWAQGKLNVTPLPALPRPCANACGALVGRTIYMAGGIETSSSTEAMHTFWSLDLDAPQQTWREMEPWPGPARMLAVAGTHDGSFYLMSGVALTADEDGKSVREYLRDAYRFTPGKGWKRLADLPRAAVAAPSPAPVVIAQGAPSLLVISGDDGLNVAFQPVEKHPGLSRESLLYDVARDAWTKMDSPEISRATVPTVFWKDGIVIPNGEVRPRVRTTDVLRLKFH